LFVVEEAPILCSHLHYKQQVLEKQTHTNITVFNCGVIVIAFWHSCNVLYVGVYLFAISLCCIVRF